MKDALVGLFWLFGGAIGGFYAILFTWFAMQAVWHGLPMYDIWALSCIEHSNFPMWYPICG